MYLSEFFNGKSKQRSGIVTIKVPTPDGSGGTNTIRGLINADIDFKMSTKWGSILPQMETLSQISQITNQANIMSWVSASTGAWKGTDPFEFGITFYLVTYEYNQSPSIKEQAKWLAQMCALYTSDESFATVKVHGGYKLNLTESNAQQNAKKYFGFTKEGGYNGSKIKELVNVNTGLISMTIGDMMTIDKLLVSNVTITPSSVQVAKGVPLYIKVEASFRTHRSLLTSDLDDMLGGRT